MAEGEYFVVDAETWSIVDGKLSLNYDRTVGDVWSSDQARNIAAAEQAWTSTAKGR